jgi:hypothetical protein
VGDTRGGGILLPPRHFETLPMARHYREKEWCPERFGRQIFGFAANYSAGLAKRSSKVISRAAPQLDDSPWPERTVV